MVRGLAHDANSLVQLVTVMLILIFRHSSTYGVDWDGPLRADDDNTHAVLYHKQTALFYQQNWRNYVHCMTLLAAVITLV